MLFLLIGFRKIIRDPRKLTIKLAEYPNIPMEFPVLRNECPFGIDVHSVMGTA
jgi:hypothetical protein